MSGGAVSYTFVLCSLSLEQRLWKIYDSGQEECLIYMRASKL